MVSASNSQVLIAAVLGCTSVWACSDDPSPIARSSLAQANAAVVSRVVLEGIGDADVATINDLVSDNFVQHSATIADGRAGFVAAVEEAGDREVEIHRTIADGAMVALHVTYGTGDNRQVGFEIFRLADGKLTEHWDAFLPWVAASESANGRTMVDGATEITDRHLTEDNRALATEFVDVVFTQGNFDRLGEYFGEGDVYEQHNPIVADGAVGLQALVEFVQSQGNMIGVTNTTMVVAEGNFVIVGAEGFRGPSTDAYAVFFDMWRVEDERLVEHWDIIPNLPMDLSTLPHSNGLF